MEYLRNQPCAFVEYVPVIVLLSQLNEGVHAGQYRHRALLAQQSPDVSWAVHISLNINTIGAQGHFLKFSQKRPLQMQ